MGIEKLLSPLEAIVAQDKGANWRFENVWTPPLKNIWEQGTELYVFRRETRLIGEEMGNSRNGERGNE